MAMNEPSQVLLSLLKRRVTNLSSITPLLLDERSRLLAERLEGFSFNVRKLDVLLNPIAQVPKHPPDEFTLASAQKRYYVQERNNVIHYLDMYVRSFLLVSDVLFETSPFVEAATDLTKNLQGVYNTLRALTEEVSDKLIKLCDTARYPDQVFDAVGELQTAWKNLKLASQHLIVVPFKASIVEEARREVISRIRKARKEGN